MKLQREIILLILCLGAVPSGAWAKNAKQIPFQLNQGSSGKNYSSKDFSQKVESLIFAATNEARQQKKLGALSQEDILVKAARDHSQDMLKRNYFSHFSPEKKSVVDRYQKYDSPVRRSLGENLHTITSGGGLKDPEAVAKQMMDDWLHSPEHQKNIMAKNYSSLGVGCASDGSRIFCTQVFAGPKS